MGYRFYIPLAVTAFVAVAGRHYKKLYANRVKNRKIIVFKNWYSENEITRSINYLKHKGVIPIRALPSIRAICCGLDANCNKQELLRDPNVLRVDDDIEISIKPIPYLFPFITPQLPKKTIIPWGVDRIRAPEVWQRNTGAGVRVAVIDTGVDLSHPMLKPNLRQGINILDPDKAPKDDNGHGTHVAGTIAAIGGAGNLIGVAPRAKIYPVKAFDGNGKALLSDLGKAVEWCVENDIRLINMSFGTSSSNPTLEEIYHQAYERDAIMVAAAGNNGPDGTVGYPGKYPFTITVGATTEDNEIANFSSRGPQVNICAPGVEILSCWLHGGTRRIKGTSMATPHVAGTVALMLERYPQLHFGQVRQILKSTAIKLAGIERNMQGMGMVDCQNAVELLY
ncbi:S8 family peptidase [Desulfuribacillus alkaliarsenatis]|uniref:Peptidase S8/S53 domain-containing protein n=1 Tax=Desulfuribacillus alkaliarsenatis TaxID=766136 RepID=A0A1E5G523_9FIRM|nr:S8 family peptidase [Desulfuribacillus alkaliarsenatis]OEF98205.1 hypothetical protein BHF68_00515 [Desulfuribacillus alkaliarsenatis]